MKKTLTLVGALICAAALTLTSCAEAPGTGCVGTSGRKPDATAPGGAAFKACMVSDSGGFDDKSFNQTSHKGCSTPRPNSASRPVRSSRNNRRLREEHSVDGGCRTATSSSPRASC